MQGPTLQNKKALRAELQLLKAETDNPWPGVGEDSMPGAMTVPRCQKQKHRPHTRERGEAEILRHPDNTPAAPSEKSDFRKCR